MFKESRSHSHKEYLITKTKPRASNCKNQCSLHVTNCLSSILMKSLENKIILFHPVFMSNKRVWWWKGHIQIVCLLLNTDFLVFPFVGFLHLSHCSFLVSLEEAILHCLTSTSSLVFHSALLHSWCIYSNWAISFTTFSLSIKYWSSWWLS